MYNTWNNYISSDPKILYGKPIIKGTRIPVDLILEKLSENESIKEILKSYPTINIEAIHACLAFASNSIKDQSVYPLSIK